ncbi:MAG: hypothetical protein RLW62_00290 [Gammaproteobacteria bacterium]
MTLTGRPPDAGGSSAGAITLLGTLSASGILSSGNALIREPMSIMHQGLTLHSVDLGELTVRVPVQLPALVPLPAAAPLLAWALVGLGCAVRRRV